MASEANADAPSAEASELSLELSAGLEKLRAQAGLPEEQRAGHVGLENAAGHFRADQPEGDARLQNWQYAIWNSMEILKCGIEEIAVAVMNLEKQFKRDIGEARVDLLQELNTRVQAHVQMPGTDASGSSPEASLPEDVEALHEAVNGLAAAVGSRIGRLESKIMRNCALFSVPEEATEDAEARSSEDDEGSPNKQPACSETLGAHSDHLEAMELLGSRVEALEQRLEKLEAPGGGSRCADVAAALLPLTPVPLKLSFEPVATAAGADEGAGGGAAGVAEVGQPSTDSISKLKSDIADIEQQIKEREASHDEGTAAIQPNASSGSSAMISHQEARLASAEAQLLNLSSELQRLLTESPATLARLDNTESLVQGLIVQNVEPRSGAKSDDSIAGLESSLPLARLDSAETQLQQMASALRGVSQDVPATLARVEAMERTLQRLAYDFHGAEAVEKCAGGKMPLTPQRIAGTMPDPMIQVGVSPSGSLQQPLLLPEDEAATSAKRGGGRGPIRAKSEPSSKRNSAAAPSDSRTQGAQATNAVTPVAPGTPISGSGDGAASLHASVGTLSAADPARIASFAPPVSPSSMEAQSRLRPSSSMSRMHPWQAPVPQAQSHPAMQVGSGSLPPGGESLGGSRKPSPQHLRLRGYVPAAPSDPKMLGTATSAMTGTAFVGAVRDFRGTQSPPPHQRLPVGHTTTPPWAAATPAEILAAPPSLQAQATPCRAGTASPVAPGGASGALPVGGGGGVATSSPALQEAFRQSSGCRSTIGATPTLAGRGLLPAPAQVDRGGMLQRTSSARLGIARGSWSSASFPAVVPTAGEQLTANSSGASDPKKSAQELSPHERMVL